MKRPSRIPEPPSDDPVAISDYMLRVTQEAYLSRNFDAFSKWFVLPQTVGTFEGDRTLRDLSDLRAVFDAMCAQFDVLGVLEMNRRTIEARFLDPSTVQATFVSQFLMRGNRLGDETVAHGILSKVNGYWQIKQSRYASPDTRFTKALHSKAREADRS